MRRLATRKLKPNMRLALAVKDHYGVLLLGKGVDLTEKNIHLLKSWGISEVYVEGKSDPGSIGSSRRSKQVSELVESELGQRFQHTEPDPFMEEIRRVAAEILKQRYMGDETL